MLFRSISSHRSRRVFSAEPRSSSLESRTTSSPPEVGVLSQVTGNAYRVDEGFARQLDVEDRLSAYRERFVMPRSDRDDPLIYFCGNSLGLMPKAATEAVLDELNDWAALAVDGHFRAKTPWYSYHEALRQPLADLTGALPLEVVAMNGLTVNLHLMMASFYRPSRERYKILVEDHAFPSDRYAVQSQIAWHGYDVEEALVVASPREGELTLRTEIGRAHV